MSEQKFKIEGIDCSACAKELEEEIGKLDGVTNCTLEFGITSHLKYTVEDDKAENVEKKMIQLIEEDQKNPIIEKENDSYMHCRFVVDGMDCAACAKELEEEIAKLPGTKNVTFEFGIHSRLQYDVLLEQENMVEKQMRHLIEEDQKNPTIIKESAGKIKTYEYRMHRIDCAACAMKMAENTKKISGVIDSSADFMHEKLTVSCLPKDRSRIEKEMIQMIAKEEPEVEVSVYTTQQESVQDDAKNIFIRLILGTILFVLSLFMKNETYTMVLAMFAYLVLGYDVIWKAIRNIGKGQVFDENFLMALATFAALYLQDFKEAAGVMLFYQIGEYFQDLAVAKSRKSIGDLMDIRPDHASVLRDGSYVTVDPEEVEIGEVIQVKPGERVPLDGIIVKGASSLDTSSLTGESKPRDVDVADEVISGSVNETGVLEVRVTKEYGESTVARILDLVENSDTNKAEHEKFITKFSRYYTPLVVVAAIVTGIVVTMVTGNMQEGIYRACTLLVVSCPCALVISIPLSFFAGIGGLSSRGVLVKGANVIDALAKVDTVVMDKTGTLTSGTFAVEQMFVEKEDSDIVRDAAYAEHYSNHPIARGIQAAYQGNIDESLVKDVKEIAGRGLSVTVEGVVILAGNAKLLKENGIAFTECNETGTLVYVAKDGIYEGCLVLRDQLKEDAIEAVRTLHEEGKKCVIVSGDAQEITDQIGKRLQVDRALGECMPEDKVQALLDIKKNGGITAFVGDGVNDAPVLANADVAFAMGGMGSDAAIEAADVVLMDDRPMAISLAIASAKRIIRTANQNIYGAIGIKILTLILIAFGYANMWMAIFADTGVAMLCILNAMRLLHIARKK